MRPVEEKDFETIHVWRNTWKKSSIPKGLYPPCGLIEDGVAAGFLTTTDTRVALMENFVTNPKAGKEEREKAMIQIIRKLQEKAYEMGYRYLLAVTNHPKIEHYIALSGGTLVQAKMYGKEL